MIAYCSAEIIENNGQFISIIDILPYDTKVDFLNSKDSIFSYVEHASAVEYDAKGEYTDNLSINIADVILDKYNNLTYTEILNSISEKTTYTIENNLGSRCGKFSLYYK